MIKPLAVDTDSLLAKHSRTAFDRLARYEEVSSESAKLALAPKHVALISLAAALAIPCEATAQHFSGTASDSGATLEEISATCFVAAALRLGGAVAYGRLGFKFLDQAKAMSSGNDTLSLAKDREYMVQLRNGGIASFTALLGFMGSVLEPDFALSPMHCELTAFAVAITTQCVYCVDKHVNDARKWGATDEQLATVVHLVCLVRARSTLLLSSKVIADSS